MRDSNDKLTMQLVDLPKLRGRPETGKAMSTAERQRLYRIRKDRLKSEQKSITAKMFDGKSMAEIVKNLDDYLWVATPDDKQAQPAKAAAQNAWLEIGRRMGWL